MDGVNRRLELLLTRMREEGIIVRYFDRPRINEYLRISIGTEEEMDRLLAAVEAWCTAAGAAAG